jgi:hypothetical protein
LENIHEVNMTRNSCKLILVLVACAVPLVAAIVNAEQNDRATGNNAASANDHAKQDYLNSQSPQRQRDREEAAHAESQGKTADARQPAKEQAVEGLGAEERPGSTFDTPDTAEHGWLVVLAVTALAISLISAGYVAWSRTQRDQGTMRVLMPHALPKSSGKTTTASTTEREATPERRAA